MVGVHVPATPQMQTASLVTAPLPWRQGTAENVHKQASTGPASQDFVESAFMLNQTYEDDLHDERTHPRENASVLKSACESKYNLASRVRHPARDDVAASHVLLSPM